MVMALIQKEKNAKWFWLNIIHLADIKILRKYYEDGLVGLPDVTQWGVCLPFHAASVGGCIAIYLFLEENIKDSAVLAKKRNKKGETLLLIACQNGNLSMVSFYLSRGISIREKDNCGQTCLISAAKEGHLHVVQFLISRCGVPVDQTDDQGWSSLFHASCGGHLPVVKYLLYQGSDIELFDVKGRSCFLVAHISKKFEVLKYLFTQRRNQGTEHGLCRLK